MKRRFRLLFILMVSFVILSGCASRILKYDKMKALETNEEYESKLEIKPETEPETEPEAKPVAKVEKTKPKPKRPKRKESKPMVKQPSLEDSEGFVGRRPVVDPFRVGEKVTLAMSYFNIVAGTMDLEVRPFVEVNGEKAYHFQIGIKSNSLFSRIYSVDDQAISYVNYETLLPYNLEIKVKESKQLAEIRSLFDWKTLKGSYWQKKVTQDKGERNKKIEWEIQPFSQNVLSAAYYLRTFTLTPGKKLAFRVADDGKNMVFRGEVLRREKLKTELGEMDTILVKPEIEVEGVFKPMGEILMWLTDDDRKFIVRIESKIKIGTIVAKIRGLDKGRE